MLSAIVAGSVGVYLLKDLGLVTLSIKTTSIGAQILGGTIFGIGWGLLGYCPGTAGGALGEGRLDAAWGLLGMVAGGALYAAFYPQMKTTVIRTGLLGKVTLPQVTGLSHWVVIILFSFMCLAIFRLFEKNGVQRSVSSCAENKRCLARRFTEAGKHTAGRCDDLPSGAAQLRSGLTQA